MTFTPPSTITFHSDSNVLSFVRKECKNKVTTYIYVYVVSRTKKGLELPLSEDEIKNLKRKEVII